MPLENAPARPVAELTVDGACGHCFSMVPLQEQNEIRHGEQLIRCEACGVILAAPEPEPEGGEEAEAAASEADAGAEAESGEAADESPEEGGGEASESGDEDATE